MQAIMETSFDVVYLVTVVTLGIIILKKGGHVKEYLLFGIMAITLGLGDAFHLVPRALALCTTGLDSFTVALGIGKFITSITMTVFYVMLYYVWRARYQITKQNGLTACIYALSAARIVLCLFPQNAWTSANAPLSWGIYRNIPFAVLGIIIIVLFYNSAKKAQDKSMRFMWLALVLSFAFYAPVVLFADTIPALGALMVPKTCAYVWVVLMGFFDMKRSLKS